METIDRFGSGPLDFMSLDGLDLTASGGLRFADSSYDFDFNLLPELGFDEVPVKTEELQSSHDGDVTDSGLDSSGCIKSEPEEPQSKFPLLKGTATKRSGVAVVTTGELGGPVPASKKAGKEEGAKTTRRRNRRTRTPKQQELNRLAQQRYRERKKQKYTSLQVVVDELSAQLDRMAIMEAEKAALNAKNTELQQLAAQQQHRIEEQAACLNQQAQQLGAQAAEIKHQQEEIDDLRSKLAVVSAAGIELESNPLYQRLASAIKTALVESGTPPAAAARVPEVVAQTIRNTLKTCCREITPQGQVAECPCPPPSQSMISVSCY